MATDIDAKRKKIARIVKKALEKEKRAPLSTEEKYKYSLKMGSRIVPEMPSRIGWALWIRHGRGTSRRDGLSVLASRVGSRGEDS